MITLLQMVGGLILLLVGGDQLVRGSSSFARLLRLSPLFIGLTIVAFGTSSPELAVSVKASLNHEAGVSVGNVIGSNIFNTLFILGVSALIVPLTATRQIVRKDIPLLIGVSLLVLLISLNGRISRPEGVVLIMLLLSYVGYQFSRARIEDDPDTGMTGVQRNPLVSLIQVTGGLAMLVFGSKLVVTGSMAIATSIGVPTIIVGLTIVGIGTSLPEVAASVVAGLRGEKEIALGNVVGSNIFNLLAVLGLAAVISPTGLMVPSSAVSFDLPVMLIATVVLLPVLVTGGRISRVEGGVMLVWYLIYLALVIISVVDAKLSLNLRIAAFGFAAPLTLIAIAMSVNAWRKARR